MVGEDPITTRADETIGYIVIEAGSGTIDGVDYVAALGADIVKSVTNAPPYSYSLSGLTDPQVAVVTMAAMDGNNGGWGLLYGASPLSATTLNIAVDEDVANDTERSHTGEQVAYIVFDAAAVNQAPTVDAGTNATIALPANHSNPTDGIAVPRSAGIWNCNTVRLPTCSSNQRFGR